MSGVSGKTARASSVMSTVSGQMSALLTEMSGLSTKTAGVLLKTGRIFRAMSHKPGKMAARTDELSLLFLKGGMGQPACCLSFRLPGAERVVCVLPFLNLRPGHHSSAPPEAPIAPDPCNRTMRLHIYYTTLPGTIRATGTDVGERLRQRAGFEPAPTFIFQIFFYNTDALALTTFRKHIRVFCSA